VPGRFVVSIDDDVALPAGRHKLIARGGGVAIVETADARALRGWKRARRVEPVYQGEFALARAVERSNISQSWLNGAPNAGRGMRIAMIDSGIDPAHAAFRASGMTMPEGYPRVRHESDRDLTSAKLIVIRNYQDMMRVGRPTAIDTVNHGTATAGAAAAVMHQTPQGWMSGAAPAAHLGIYKVGPAGNGAAWQSDAVILAIHDAMADGMDVICLSLGFTYGTPYGDTLLSEAIEKAERAGIIVVGAAGNGGPNPRTIGAIAVTDAMITTGAVLNDRRFMNTVRAGEVAMAAYASESSPAGLGVWSGALVDVETLDRDGLACRAFTGVAGRIALVARGACTFAEKLANAAAAGASAVVVYNSAGEAFPIPATASKVPTMMVSHADGLALKNQRASSVALDFQLSPVNVDGDGMAAFSARGPSPMLTIEPDVSAVGESMLLPLPGGVYKILQGTSFSAPLLAGAAAVLKQQRPGLTAAQYRSLLVNTAAAVTAGKPQEAGAGLLDLAAAMRAPVVASVTSVNFGVYANAAINARRDLMITNLSGVAQDLGVFVDANEGDSVPAADAAAVHIEPGATARVTLRWVAALKPGAYQGVIRVGGLRVPYWMAVPTERPAHVTVLRGGDTWPAEEVVSFIVNITDEAGLLTGAARPAVIPVDGPGLVSGQTLQVTPLNGLDGHYYVMIMLAKQPGVNQFRVQAGGARTVVSFAGVPD